MEPATSLTLLFVQNLREVKPGRASPRGEPPASMPQSLESLPSSPSPAYTLLPSPYSWPFYPLLFKAGYFVPSDATQPSPVLWLVIPCIPQYHRFILGTDLEGNQILCVFHAVCPGILVSSVHFLWLISFTYPHERHIWAGLTHNPSCHTLASDHRRFLRLCLHPVWYVVCSPDFCTSGLYCIPFLYVWYFIWGLHGFPYSQYHLLWYKMHAA